MHGMPRDAMALAHTLISLTQNEATEAEGEPGPNVRAALHPLSQARISDWTLRARRKWSLLEWRHPLRARSSRRGWP